MSKHVLFIHGAGDEGYDADKKLVSSLRAELGVGYDLHYPHMQTNESAQDFDWQRQIGNAFSDMQDDAILVGHSLGASMMLKYLSENEIKKKIAGIFLLSTPFWSGNEEWKKGLMLRTHFADSLPRDVPIFFYHCRDDEEVPFWHMAVYQQELTWATYRAFNDGGHQLNNDLTLVANDIMSATHRPKIP